INNNVCQGNGSRDVTVDNMESTLDSWSAPEGGDAIEALSRSYAHQGYLATVMMTDTVGLLNSVFSGKTNETTLLFAREETYRTSTLGDATVSGASVSVPMDSTHAAEIVQASMSWTRYQYSGGSWSVYNSEDDSKRLKLQLSQEDFFKPADSSSDSVAEANGKILTAQAYYTAMLTGATAMVQVAGATTWKASGGYGEIDELSYSAEWPKTTFTGATYTAFAVGTMLVDAIKGAFADTGSGFWKSLANSFESPQTTTSFVKSLKGSQQFSNGLMALT